MKATATPAEALNRASEVRKNDLKKPKRSASEKPQTQVEKKKKKEKTLAQKMAEQATALGGKALSVADDFTR